jgi:hypothetical protein
MDAAMAENEADADLARQLMRIGYVNLTAAVVDGEPPSFEDVLYRVSTDDTATWSEAARRLNSQWFPDPTPSPSPTPPHQEGVDGEGCADVKKKRRRSRST